MKIAILMSTYNGEKYLSMQLDSLVNQTMSENITLYIRDDGSNDNTVKIIKSYVNKIKIILYTEDNVGPAKSFWNLLNKRINADYILFCDQDDVWDAEKTERSIVELEKGYSLVACNCRIIDSSGNIQNNKRLTEIPRVNIPRLFITGYTQGCSIAFTKEVRDFIIQRDIKCIPMHDIIVILYSLSVGNIGWIDTPLFSYRVHESNVVAKNGSILKNIKTIIWNWNNSAQNSMSNVAYELLKKGKNLSLEDITYLSTMANYKKSIKNRLFLINYNDVSGIDNKCLRSYKIRLFLKLL